MLLRLLEQPDCRLNEQAVVERWPGCAAELMSCGALVMDGTARSIIVADDRGVRQVDVDWHAERRTYCYFDGVGGFVEPPAAALRLLRLDFAWWLRWLSDHLQLVNAGKPVELVPDLAWDMGDLWVTPKTKVPVLFARRIRTRLAAHKLMTAIQARSGRAGGILLSSTASIDMSAPWPLHFQQHPLQRMLAADAAWFTIDIASLKAPYGGSSPRQSAGIHLSPDNAVLTLNGTILTFGGAKQQAILRKLVDAYEAGRRLQTADVLGDLAANSLAKAFRGNPNWPALKTVIRQENGLCWLEA